VAPIPSLSQPHTLPHFWALWGTARFRFWDDWGLSTLDHFTLPQPPSSSCVGADCCLRLSHGSSPNSSEAVLQDSGLQRRCQWAGRLTCPARGKCCSRAPLGRGSFVALAATPTNPRGARPRRSLFVVLGESEPWRPPLLSTPVSLLEAASNAGQQTGRLGLGRTRIHTQANPANPRQPKGADDTSNWDNVNSIRRAACVIQCPLARAGQKPAVSPALVFGFRLPCPTAAQRWAQARHTASD
jgi:hypothetical protein